MKFEEIVNYSLALYTYIYLYQLEGKKLKLIN